MNETLTLHPDGRTTLRMQRRLPHPPAKVWRAITQPQHLAAWFPAEVTIDADRISYGFGPDGRITENDPPHTFTHTWGEDELRWQLQPDGTGTLLTFSHTFSDRHGAGSFAAGWHECITALHAHLDDRPHHLPDQPDPARTARLHEDYIAILGLPSTTADGDTVRVERQLTRPAQDVWQHLDGPAATRHTATRALHRPGPAGGAGHARGKRQSPRIRRPRRRRPLGVHRGHRPRRPPHRHPHRRHHHERRLAHPRRRPGRRPRQIGLRCLWAGDLSTPSPFTV